MGKVLEFRTEKQDDVNSLLQSAIDNNFDKIWVVGIRDGNVHLSAAGSDSVIHDLGILEAVKDHLLRSWT